MAEKKEAEKKVVVKKIDNKIKNTYGFVKGTRKDMYCQLLKEGKWGKDQILAKVKAKFGSASPNAFSFFLRDCKLKKIAMRRRVIIMFK